MKYIQRVKQFYWSMFDKMNYDDICYVNKFLNREESDLFYKLSSSEQKHSVRVARMIEKKCDKLENVKINKIFMIKAGLLHDVGKIISRINPIEKSIFVLLNLFTKGKLRKYSNFNKIKVFYYHGELGYDILKSLNYNEKFLNIIKNHHNLNCIYYEVTLLRECDDKC